MRVIILTLMDCGMKEALRILLLLEQFGRVGRGITTHTKPST